MAPRPARAAIRPGGRLYAAAVALAGGLCCLRATAQAEDSVHLLFGPVLNDHELQPDPAAILARTGGLRPFTAVYVQHRYQTLDALDVGNSVSGSDEIPTGVDTDFFSPNGTLVEASSLVFTGSMDWLPNEDAILYFTKEILPIIKKEIPDITFDVVGRNPSTALKSKLLPHPEIKLLGRVDDVRPYMGRNCIYIIPLRIGGGTRIKVYEAMAMGKAIVSTSVGTEGLPVAHEENVVIADTPTDFAQSVIKLIRDKTAREKIEKSARCFVENNCSWQRAAQVFGDICRYTTSGKVKS